MGAGKKLTKEQIDLVENSVQKIETLTSAEVVPVILKQSDFYESAHFRSAIFFSVLLSFVWYYVPWKHSLNSLYLIYAQALFLLVGHCLAYIPALKKIFSTETERSVEVRQRAIEIFYDQGISKTRERVGVLVLISLLEREIIILTDSGIKEKIGNEIWDKLISEFTQEMQYQQLVPSLVKLLEQVGEKLKDHFPQTGLRTSNEIANKLVID